MTLFSDKEAEIESEVESEDDQLYVKKLAELKEAQEKERVRLANIDLQKRVGRRARSPASPGRKAKPTANKRSCSADSLSPPGKKRSPRMVKKKPKHLKDDDDKAPSVKGRVSDDDDSLSSVSMSPPRKKAGKRNSELFPRDKWPEGMSKEDVDELTRDKFLMARKCDLEQKQFSKENEELPGFLMHETTLFLAPIVAEGGEHDFVSKLCPASLVHFPIGEPIKFWHLIPVEWKVVTAEYGYKERGAGGRIAKATWMSAHNRRWASELCHWSTANAAAHRRDKHAILKMGKDGMKLSGSNKTEFHSPKTVLEVYDCLR